MGRFRKFGKRQVDIEIKPKRIFTPPPSKFEEFTKETIDQYNEVFGDKTHNMRLIKIQSDSRVIITTSEGVATVSRECILLNEKEVTIQETNLITDFEIVSCQLIHLHSKILAVHAVVMVGHQIVIQVQAGIVYDGEDISLTSLVSAFNGIELSGKVQDILSPLIRDHIEYNLKPQIHQFYNEQ